MSRVPRAKKTLKNILCVGTVCARKGTHTLIEAFIQCLDCGLIPKDTVLTIVGFPSQIKEDDSFVCDLIMKVITSRFRDNIRMVESVSPDQLLSFFEETDLFVQSSVMECLPLALLSAMSYGLPIITTNVDGCGEVIEDGITGYTCLPYHIDSLANSLTEAIGHPEQSLRLGKRAQEVFNEKYSLESTQETILAELKME